MSRVFILDYDLVSPLGVGKAAVFKSIEQNSSAANQLERFSVEGLPVTIGAQVKEPLENYLSEFSKQLRDACRYDRKLELLLACQALWRSRVQKYFRDHNVNRAGVILGMGLDVIPLELIESELKSDRQINGFQSAYEKLNSENSEHNTVSNPLDLAAMIIAQEFKLLGFQKVSLTACSASSQAIAMAAESIKSGDMDVVVAGGSDSLLNLIGVIAFSKLGVIQPVDGAPESVCKPLDKNRNSVLLGEGAGLVLLASEEFVKSRKLKPFLEIAGYGNTLDGYKITAPDPEASGMRRAMEQALESSGVVKEDVDYINMHGTGTQANDPLELLAIREVFGKKAASLPVSSTKDRHGHLIAAAGIMEFTVLNMCMENNLIPCTRNLKKPIVDIGMDLVANENRRQEINVALSNSFAFGGVNTVLVLKKVRETLWN